MSIADPNTFLELIAGTKMAIDTFLNEDRLQCSEAKDRSGREQAVNNSYSNLYYTLRCGNLECWHGLFLSFWRVPFCYRIEGELPSL